MSQLDAVLTALTDAQVAMDRRVGELERQETGLRVDTTAVSNPPTAAQLNAIFGTPAALYESFTAIVDSGGTGTNVWLVSVVSGSWYYIQFTQAL